MPVLRLLTATFVLSTLGACDVGPNGMGTAPPGVSQQEYEARIAARRKARGAYYRGPRGGTASR